MKIAEHIRQDPFRLYFPFAILFAFYACSLWLTFSLFNQGEYPGIIHAELFIGGFLYLMVIGFLMTAIPRFTESPFASSLEIKISISLIIALLLASIIQKSSIYWFIIMFGWFFLVSFSVKRFFHRTQNPPYTFLFVGLGIVMGSIGSCLILLSLILEISIDLENFGKMLFYDGMPLSLILGVGGRLIPGILGFQDIVSSQKEIYEKPGSFFSKVPLHIFILASLFFFSFLFENFSFVKTSYFLKAIVISFVAFKYWRIHRIPLKKNKTSFFLRVACLFILITPWLIIFFPDYIIDLKHLSYIGGYSLITFLVAARVTLAHGKQGLSLESNHYPYTFFATVLIIAALTRATAILMPETYLNHLGYAAIMYLLGTLLWTVFFLPRLILTFK